MTMAHERIDRIPADQFNHSVCVVQHRNGQYELLDPTWVPGVRELWSSAEQQQGYLMGLPNGADLMETPVSPAEKHYVRITGTSKIKKNGTLVGTFTVTAEGQSDAAVRGVFKARQSEWQRNLEMELLRKKSPKAIGGRNPFREHSLPWAAWIIARLGGWSGYLSAHGRPGYITMKEGLERFSQRLEIIAFARARDVYKE